MSKINKTLDKSLILTNALTCGCPDLSKIMSSSLSKIMSRSVQICPGV